MKYFIKDHIDVILILLLFILIIFCFIAVGEVAIHNFEKGYQTACEDFYNGKIKYERIVEDEKIVWKKVEN